MINRLSVSVQKRWEERKKLILSADFRLSDTTAEKEDRIERAQKDYDYFVRTYFPHLCTDSESGEIIPSAPFHIDAANYLKKHRNARCLFEWARGHAKSTHISLITPLWLYIQETRTINVMLLVSKSEDAADRLLSDLQCELEFNTLLKSDFNIEIDSSYWGIGEFRTKDGVLFISIGRGQSPRGIKNRGKRPDYVVVDDIDDDEIVRNDARIAQAFDWCMNGTVLPALTRLGIVPANMMFSFNSEEDTGELWSRTAQAMQYYEIDPAWIKNRFGIEVTQKKNSENGFFG